MKCPKCKVDNPDDSRFCNKCGTSLIDIPETPTEAPTKTSIAPQKSTLDFAPGQHFGKRYQIIEEVGQGGMGRVYKAVDQELNRIVALKMIKPEISSQPGIVERFKKEIKLASQITHKNVCRIHDLGQAQGIKFISMQYIKGQDLKGFIKQSGRLTTEKTIDLTMKICAALQAAHDEGVIHRDLKPENIMLDGEGIAYVMDFGIAKSLEAEELTKEGTVVGTPHYMSPQQAAGEEVDHRSDIYSLGAIMYEVLTGRPPFKADSDIGIIHKHITETPKPPSNLNPQIPKVLEEIILKCLKKKPEERFQKADDVIKAIDEAKPKAISIAESARARKNSIAVLPFADMSPQKDQEYFCDGISEELINALTKVEGLQVVSRTSAFQFKGKGYNIHKIGDELKVQTVLEGSVRKAGNKLRIAAQLIDVEGGYHLWSEKYDRDMEDIFSIQDEISLAIVDKLKVRLLGKEKAALTKRYTQDLDAYNLYLKGIYFWNKRYEGGMKRGLEYFQQAIQRDPTYALAYTGIAGCYMSLGWFDWLHPKEAFTKAKEAAEKALQMDDTIAEAHNSLAFAKFLFDWEWVVAEREFKRALELNPRSAEAHHWYSHYLAGMGRQNEAYAEIKQALQLDPLALIANAALGWYFFLDHKYDQGMYMQKGMYDKAIIPVQKAIDLTGEASLFVVTICMIYTLAGKKSEAKKLLKELLEQSKQKYVSPFYISLIHLGLGQKDKAFEWLERAYEQRTHWMVYIKLHPMLDPLRSDPRFKALLKKMNLE